jgi:GcrA cell cycle regulator
MFAIKPTWTAERVELLKSRYQAGFSCREIAQVIGVSRNAVIGKISRLNLSRPRRLSGRRPERKGVPKVRRSRLVTQHQILMALHAKPQPSAEEVPIHNGHRCSLLELSQEKCRWPIGNPCAEDFWFCGNKPVEGLPYCAGHARMAYQLSSRPHAARP